MVKVKKVSVIGLGYIGLPTAAVIASNNMNVIGVDINRDVVETINAGKIHIVEPELDAVVNRVVRSGLLHATTEVQEADVFIISVPTPFKGENHEPDLSYVEAACKAIAPVLSKDNLIILESTSPVGATEMVAKFLAVSRPDLSFPNQQRDKACIKVAYCPERVLPGNVLHELVFNDRVVGGLTEECSNAAVAFYSSFVKGECVVTNARTAEMAKLTENSFRDVNIAFANELSLICDRMNINVWELIKLANRHPRVNILNPGPGVGGHCIAVDPWFIVNSCPDYARMIRTAREVNDYKSHYVIDKVKAAINVTENPVIACLGLAFKADIDDLRESPALEIVETLGKGNIARLLVVEPNINDLPKRLEDSFVELVELEYAIKKSNIVLVLVDHKQFENIKKSWLIGKTIIDTRGLINKLGFGYV